MEKDHMVITWPVNKLVSYKGYCRHFSDGHALQVSIEDIADILQMANRADNLVMQQRTVPTTHQRVTKEFYDTAGGIDNRFKQKN